MKWFLLALQRWRDFSGRSRRREYWFFQFFSAFGSVMLSALAAQCAGAGASHLATAAWGAAMLVPGLAVGWRRMHDVGLGGWIYIALSLPLQFSAAAALFKALPGADIAAAIFSAALIVLLCRDSAPAANRWGPRPK